MVLGMKQCSSSQRWGEGSRDSCCSQCKGQLGVPWRCCARLLQAPGGAGEDPWGEAGLVRYAAPSGISIAVMRRCWDVSRSLGRLGSQLGQVLGWHEASHWLAVRPGRVWYLLLNPKPSLLLEARALRHHVLLQLLPQRLCVPERLRPSRGSRGRCRLFQEVICLKLLDVHDSERLSRVDVPRENCWLPSPCDGDLWKKYHCPPRTRRGGRPLRSNRRPRLARPSRGLCAPSSDLRQPLTRFPWSGAGRKEIGRGSAGRLMLRRFKLKLDLICLGAKLICSSK